MTARISFLTLSLAAALALAGCALPPPPPGPVLTPAGSGAGSMTISGTVLDSEGRPAASVLVEVVETPIRGVTSSTGEFRLSFPAGRFAGDTLMVHLHRLGLKDEIFRFRAVAGSTLDLGEVRLQSCEAGRPRCTPWRIR